MSKYGDSCPVCLKCERFCMLIIVKVKDAGDIIGLKEEIAMRLEDVIGIERIDVKRDEAVSYCKK